jgi:hypothetical protein
MLLAIKGNREEKIDINEQAKFIADGYKIIELDDKKKETVIHDPSVVKVDAELEAKIVELEKTNLELTTAKAEADTKIAELEAKIVELGKKKA